MDLELEPGTCTALIGPNGAGKTTLVNAITGFVDVESGRVYFGSRNLTGADAPAIARIGVVRTFQEARLLGSESAVDNVILGTALAASVNEGLSGAFFPGNRSRHADAKREAMRLLSLLRLADLAMSPTARLSYGQRKLVSLAIAAGTGAIVLLLDEPFSGLDAHATEIAVNFLRSLTSQGTTLLFIEHDLDLVKILSSSVVVMRNGMITEHGLPGTILRPAFLKELFY